MLKTLSFAVLLAVLAGCASSPEVPATSGSSPYGTPDDQRQRAGRATQELDRSLRY